MLVIDRSVGNKSSTKPSKLITSTYGQTHVISVLIAYPQMSLLKTPMLIYLAKLNPYFVNRNKSRLLFSSAEMFKKPLWQTVRTQIRLLL